MRHSRFTYCCESQLKRPDHNISFSSSNAGESVCKLSGFEYGGKGFFWTQLPGSVVYFSAHFDTLAKYLVATYCNHRSTFAPAQPTGADQ